MQANNNILALSQIIGAEMTPAERQRSLLLYTVYWDYREQGLEIAEKLIDELSACSPDFDDRDFWSRFHARLRMSKLPPEEVERTM